MEACLWWCPPGFCTGPGVVWLVSDSGEGSVPAQQLPRTPSGRSGPEGPVLPSDGPGQGRVGQRGTCWTSTGANAGVLHLGRSKRHVLVDRQLSLSQQGPEGRGGRWGPAGSRSGRDPAPLLSPAGTLESCVQLWILRAGGRTWMSWGQQRLRG